MGVSIQKVFSFSLKLRIILVMAIVCSGALFQSIAVADEKTDEASALAMQEGVIAFESKMYDFSKNSFEKAIEYDRSNYDAMLYLAKANFYWENYPLATKSCHSLTSSFYPAKHLKIDAFTLMGDIENKLNNPWLALSYIHAASELSTNVDI